MESTFVAPAAPVLYATAIADTTVPPSTIIRVDFLDGSNVIGSVATPNAIPSGYVFTWLGASAGVHSISARATDSLGDSTTSNAVILDIVPADPPPQVALSAPTTGMILAPGASMTLAATATSTVRAIYRVEFSAGGQVIATTVTAPYSAIWANPLPGTFAIVAKAFDDIGVAATSAAAYVTVLAAARRPSVVLTSPAPGTTFSAGAPISMAASALAPDGAIARVDFYADITLVGSAASAPYQFTWANPTAGTQPLTAKAFTSQGANATSAPVTVTVATGTVPVVNLVSPIAGATFTAPATVALSAAASEAGGSIAKVEFFANGSLVGTATSSPYNFSWSGVAIGSYAVTAKATDGKGATATSSAATINVFAPATVSLTAPPDGAKYGLGQPITITAQGAAPGRSISRVEFYNDGTLIGTSPVTGGPSAITVNLTWSGAASGAHALSAKVFTADGASGISSTVNITVSSLAVVLVEPAPGQIYQTPAQIRITANPSEAGGTITQVDFFGDGVLLGSSTSAPYSFVWNGAPAGSHVISALVHDAAALTAGSAPVTVTVIASPTITVDAGIDGSAIADDNASVSGTVQAQSNAAVIINGQLAALDQNGRFFLDNLTLAPGSNTITLILNSMDGAPVTRTIALNSTGAAPFTVVLDKQEGLAPLTVNLTIRNRGGVPFKRIEIDRNDDGAPDVTLNSLAADGTTVPLLYSTPGIYTIRVKVFDANDAVIYTTTRRVRAIDPTELVHKVNGVYDAIVGRLAANNINGALNAFTWDSRAKYSTVFNALSATLPSVATQLGSLAYTVVIEDFAELTLLRNNASGGQAFLIYLVRGADGIWRVETM
jgi:Bacterial Ig domain/Glucodextranase, domain B